MMTFDLEVAYNVWQSVNEYNKVMHTVGSFVEEEESSPLYKVLAELLANTCIQYTYLLYMYV